MRARSAARDRVGHQPCRADEREIDRVARPHGVIVRIGKEPRCPHERAEGDQHRREQSRREHRQDIRENCHTGGDVKDTCGSRPEAPRWGQPRGHEIGGGLERVEVRRTEREETDAEEDPSGAPKVGAVRQGDRGEIRERGGDQRQLLEDTVPGAKDAWMMDDPRQPEHAEDEEQRCQRGRARSRRAAPEQSGATGDEYERRQVCEHDATR